MSSKSKRKTQPPGAASSPVFRYWPYIALGIVVVFFSAIRIRLLHLPLERDEGEYAYAGQLILQGIAPFKLAYNMKLPGTYAAYALIMAVFGQTPAGIHLGMILVNGITAVVMFFLARRLFDVITGVAAACSYAVLSNSEEVLGFHGHATHFVVLFALPGILALLHAIATRRRWLFFLSGVLMGLAFVMKQPGLAFVMFGAFYLAVSEWRQLSTWTGFSRLVIYGIGAACPFLLTCLVMFLAGVLCKMWFWTFSYASQYASVTVLWDAWDNLFMMGSKAVEPSFLMWVLALLGLAALAWDSRLWRHARFILSFLAFSWLGVTAGFYFRPHYFVLVLPAVSLLAGITIGSAKQELSKFVNKTAATAIPALIFVIVMAASIALQRDTLFYMDMTSISRASYGAHPFPEAEVISQYLQARAAPGARIAVFGSEPEIFFLTHRHSATGYIYVYPLFEPQKFALEMQHEMAKEVEQNHPEYVVMVKVAGSWGVRPESEKWFLGWSQDYVKAHYELVGVADEVSPQTRYVWGDAAKDYKEESESSVEIFKLAGQPETPAHALSLTPATDSNPST